MSLGPIHDKEKIIREEEHGYDIPLHDGVIQPLTSQTLHITPPANDYIAPVTNPILNKYLNEFKEEFFDNTKVSNDINSNHVNDLKEHINTYDFETFIGKLLHQARTTMGKENMKETVPRDLPPTLFLGHLKEQIVSPYRTRETVCMIENPGEVHKLKAQEEERDMNVSWDITIEDVERLRQFLTPTIHTLPNHEPVVQPYMSLGPIHDKEKIIREEEHGYDIPLHDGHMILRPSLGNYFTK
nr:hypothetical protein [Tanacetum cinerariifolium]